MAGEGTATGAKRDVGHGTVWVNDDIRYIAMQVSRLEALQGVSLTDSGISQSVRNIERCHQMLREPHGLAALEPDRPVTLNRLDAA